jgi:hypothetical protein
MTYPGFYNAVRYREKLSLPTPAAYSTSKLEDVGGLTLTYIFCYAMNINRSLGVA